MMADLPHKKPLYEEKRGRSACLFSIYRISVRYLPHYTSPPTASCRMNLKSRRGSGNQKGGRKGGREKEREREESVWEKEKEEEEEGLKVRKVWMKESRKRENEMKGLGSKKEGRRRSGNAAAQYAARRLVAAEKLWGAFPRALPASSV